VVAVPSSAPDLHLVSCVFPKSPVGWRGYAAVHAVGGEQFQLCKRIPLDYLVFRHWVLVRSLLALLFDLCGRHFLSLSNSLVDRADWVILCTHCGQGIGTVAEGEEGQVGAAQAEDEEQAVETRESMVREDGNHGDSAGRRKTRAPR